MITLPALVYPKKNDHGSPFVVFSDLGQVDLTHFRQHCFITVTSWWARWRLKSPAYRLVTQPFLVCSSKKTSKLCVTGLCEGNSPVTGEFPAQRAGKAGNVSIWWRHRALPISLAPLKQPWEMQVNQSQTLTRNRQEIYNKQNTTSLWYTLWIWDILCMKLHITYNWWDSVSMIVINSKTEFENCFNDREDSITEV